MAASFRAEGLIAEYRVSIMPVILGTGIPLLGRSGSRENLRLLETRSYANGVVQLRHARIDPI